MPGKARYGEAWPNEAASDNFLVVWENNNGNNALANRTLDTLERTWKALVDEADWQQPVSSEDYLLWVVLSPELSETGFTTSYTSSEFPKGYPVIYLNPNYAQDTRFWDSLSAHEFAHALQYVHRSYSTNLEEPWYWEASAEWLAELALPEVNAYGAQSWYYAEQSHFRYSSMENAHQYGMFVLNAHIEEHLTGPGSVKSIWELAAQNPNKNWDELLSEGLNEPISTLFAGFTQSMATMNLKDAIHYYAPKSNGILLDQSAGRLPYLGTHYWKATTDAWVTVEGEVILASEKNLGDQVVVFAGENLAVTGLNKVSLTNYTLTLAPIPEDSGIVDSGEGADTGTPEKETPGGCACDSSPSQKAPFWIVASACLFYFKRRAPRRPFSS